MQNKLPEPEDIFSRDIRIIETALETCLHSIQTPRLKDYLKPIIQQVKTHIDLLSILNIYAISQEELQRYIKNTPPNPLQNMGHQLQKEHPAKDINHHQVNSPPKNKAKKSNIIDQAIEYAHQKEYETGFLYYNSYALDLFGNSNIHISFMENQGDTNKIFKHIHKEHSTEEWYTQNEKEKYPAGADKIKDLKYKNLYGLLIKCLKNQDLKDISCHASKEMTDKETKEKISKPCFMIEGKVIIHNNLYKITFALASTKHQKQGQAKFLLRSFYAERLKS